MKYFRKLEVQLDEDIEKEEDALDMECIKADKAYIDCSGILKEFDANNREFFNEVESLLNVYADAAENVSKFDRVSLICNDILYS